MSQVKISGSPRKSSGAQFYRCALQVNPFSYKKQFRGCSTAGDEETHAACIIESALANNIKVIAITNHNDAKAASAFQDAARGTGVTVFPGFELESRDGIHILCLYSPKTNAEQLGRFLGEFGIRSATPSAEPASTSFVDTLSKVRAQGGIGIAAHAISNKGLFTSLSGQARAAAWRSPDLMAIQIPGPVDKLHQKVLPIVRNELPDYRRRYPAGENLAVAVINAKDVVDAADLADPAASCLIKMSRVSIDGLRQAFLDPDSRIRLNSDPQPKDHTEILSLAWEAGFLDGMAIHFNTNLNVLIGGRGAGKSTVIESLRYVLDKEPVGDEANRAHSGIVQKVLRPGSKLSLRVRTTRPSTREYVIERSVSQPPVVKDDSGNISQLRPTDILPKIEIFGQHEILELARSPVKRTSLLDRFLERDDSLTQRTVNVQRNLEETRRSILSTNAELQRVEDQLASLPKLEETLDRYQEVGLEERLRERSLLVREQHILDSIPERLHAFHEALELLRQELPVNVAFVSDQALAELPGRATLAEIVPVFRELGRALEQVVGRMEKALERSDSAVEAVRRKWEARKTEVEDEYRQILRGLRQAAADGEEFIRLRGEVERLRPLRKQWALLQRLEQEHVERRKQLLAEWETIQAARHERLRRAAAVVSERLHNQVKVDVTAAGDRRPLGEALRNEIGGRLSEAIDKLMQAPGLSMAEFVQCCRSGAAKLRQAYSIPSTQADRLAQASKEALMVLEELELPSTTEIRLNTAPSGDPPSWQAMDSLSTGQKATSLLLLLLLDSDAPLVIDQPEDDLDNRFITESVVPAMRKAKRQRQFIFSTHNANILVLGDAELILGLTPSGEAGYGRAEIKPEHEGSIDSGPVREFVEEILEGGQEAFEIRRLKYGF